MWVVYAPPSDTRTASERVGIRKKQKQADPSPDSSPSPSNDNQTSAASNQLGSSIAELLEPALDGPPSPERIRALSKQVQSGSAVDRHHSQQTTSSGSSSLRSLTSGDGPPWEQSTENTTLSRKSSTRSTSSSMPSRERPESVQIFGKTIFNRRTKLKRESSAQSSSASSMYGDVPAEAVTSPPPAPSARELIPGIFNRRRTLKAEAARDESAVRRRLQISGPYNFQHVTHTNKDVAAGVQRMDRADYNTLQSARDAFRECHPGEAHFAGFSSEALPLEDDMGMLSPCSEPQFDMGSSHYPGSPGSPQRPVRGTRSQEQLRLPPPRPPRSPLEPSFTPAGSIPQAPRTHTGSFYDSFAQVDDYDPSRSSAAVGFRLPQPFAVAEQAGDMAISPQGHAEGPSADENRFSYAFGNALDTSNWPLMCPVDHSFETVLPDVPEEEEQVAPTHRSRASVRSTNSSLRVSQSVPLLRQMVQPQPATRRPPSGDSVTLGRMELSHAQKGMRRSSLRDEDGVEASVRDSWEEVIDYCYDHQAEASCDYAWDRPSLDLVREDVSTGGAGPETGRGRRDSELLPGVLYPGQFDVPALSPASQVSTAVGQETSPLAVAGLLSPRSNFSRKEPPPRQRLLHIRTASQASSFKESHGFDLSPSLFIPGDYHQELLAHQAAKLLASDDPTGSALYEEPRMTMNTSTLFVQSRSSASTTETQDSAQSTASTATDYTRLTASTASMHIDDMSPKQEHGSPVPETSAPIQEQPASRSPMPVLFETNHGLEKPFRRIHGRGSESNLLKKRSEDLSAGLRREPIPIRRGRARTTSLSSPPPTGQYAIFPSVNMSGHFL